MLIILFFYKKPIDKKNQGKRGFEFENNDTKGYTPFYNKIYHGVYAMGYLNDFLTQINTRDFSKFLQLWEEYCTSDRVETEELVQLLKAIKESDFAKMFGQMVETALPLWGTIQDENESYEVLKYLIDLQLTNTPLLADLATKAVHKKYGHQLEYNDRLRLVGLRTKDKFQGALFNYDLLDHIGVGKFVFHGGGWGTGEIMEVSPVREQLAIEFENVAGRKHVTYVNAFKTLIPLDNSHFLVRRFADADLLEKEAKEDPVAVIKLLLQGLGPKSALEIKDELCGSIIPEEEWTKWWQAARSKIKKDTMIESPEGSKGAFKLRTKEVSHEEQLNRAIEGKTDADEIIQTTYNFVRDQHALLKKEEVRAPLLEKLVSLLKSKKTTPSQELQALIILDTYFSHSIEGQLLANYIIELQNVETVVNTIEILAIKKRAMGLIRECRSDWVELFIAFFFSVSQGALRDYVVKELNQDETKAVLISALEKLLVHPERHPELFVWFFQKIVSKGNEDFPFSDKEGQHRFFEAFFILYSKIEQKSEYRDLIKKMYLLMSGKRYAVVRALLEGTSLEFVKELLLLTAKCRTLSDHDIKILRSLVEVVHPSLAAAKPRRGLQDTDVIWTTEAGYLRTQERARQVGTVEIVENAREIEAARALGDLRENSEYKFALEKRSRLQSELKTLSDQLAKARLISPDQISTFEVGVGSVVELLDLKNNKSVVYTILGQWDADVDAGILSSQSKFAEAMFGLKKGDTLKFRDEEFKVVGLKSYLDK